MSQMRIVVFHDTYGCETGCCGHVIEADGETASFEFEHPWNESSLEFAQRLVRDMYGEEHIKDLDWDNCIVRVD